MPLVIVDTDVLIDAGRGLSEAVACLQDIEKRSTLAISAVTEMEYWSAATTNLNSAPLNVS